MNHRYKQRTSFVARLLPLHAQQRRQLVKAEAKCYSAAHKPDATERQQTNWKVMSSYNMISPYISSWNILEHPDFGRGRPGLGQNGIAPSPRDDIRECQPVCTKYSNRKTTPTGLHMHHRGPPRAESVAMVPKQDTMVRRAQGAETSTGAPVGE